MERKLIDDKAVAKLIKDEVKRSVDAQVNSALSDPEWIIELENRNRRNNH